MQSRYHLLVPVAVFCVCFCAYAKPSKRQMLQSSAAFLLKQLVPKYDYLGKGDYLFIQAIDATGKDITTNTTVEYLRRKKHRVFPYWTSKKLRPSGDYLAVQLIKPQFVSSDLVKWEVAESYLGLWRPESEGGRTENSYAQSWVWLQKNGASWKIIRRKNGISAG